VRTNFQTSVGDYGSTTVNLVDHITLADNSVYSFTYEGTLGASDGAVTGRLASVTLPNGGRIGYTYPGCNNNGGMQADGVPCLMVRTTSDGAREYHHYAPNGNQFSNYVIDEQGNRSDYNFIFGTNGNPYELHRAVNQGTSPSLEERDTFYNADFNRTNALGMISQVDIAEAQNGNRLSHNATFYNPASGLQTVFQQFDYQDNTLRKTIYTYDANNNLIDQLTNDGSGNMVAHTGYGYDESAVTTTGGITQHTTAAGSRNNRTSTHQYINGSSTLNSSSAYYDTGAVQSSTSPSGTTSYGYDATQGFTTTTNLPTPSSGVALGASASYDATAAALVSATGYNAGQTVTVNQYDKLLRPLSVTAPDQGVSTYYYSPSLYDVQHTIDSRQTNDAVLYDGYGRPYRTAKWNGTVWYMTDTCYGPMGLPAYTSTTYADNNLYLSNNCSSGSHETYIYDALGRPTQVLHADGSHEDTAYLIYNGALSTKVTSTNSIGSLTRIVDTDAIGRTVIACEVSSTTQGNGESPGACNTAIGASGFKTSYAYNDAQHTTTVSQGVQTRVFQTDALGRTIYTNEPERGVTSFGYTYQGNELLVTRVRPRANQMNPNVTTTTTTRYDTLSRPTIVQYTATDTGQALQPQRLYYHDAAKDGVFGSANAKGLLTEAYLNSGDTNEASTRYSYDIMGRVSGMFECAPGWCTQLSTRAMYRGYVYDQAGNKTNESWTVGFNNGGGLDSVGLTNTYTAAGELDSMKGGLNDANLPLFPYFYKAGMHTPAGTASEQYGNGLYGNSLYDAMNRNSGKWVCTSNTPTICGGTNARNGYADAISGQQITRLIDPLGDRSFNYDDLGRLKTSSITNGPLMQSWDYDRYGNRYAQHDSNHTGYPAPAYTFNYGKNQIAMTGFSYDAAGNMLTDSFHAYTYDAEGNVVLVDGGNTAWDVYDAQNRRVSHQANGAFLRYEYNADGQLTDIWNGEEQYEHTSRYYANGRNFAYWNVGTLHFQHADYLGTVRVRTNDVGAVEGDYYSLPFGDGYSHTGTDDNAQHFALLERDGESDTQQATFRKYSSTQGRWLSPDPVNTTYNYANPQSFNRYTYAGNNPLSFIDPDGTSEGGPCDGSPCGGGSFYSGGWMQYSSHSGPGSLVDAFKSDMMSILGGFAPSELGNAQLPLYVTDNLASVMTNLAAAGFRGEDLNKGPKPNTGGCISAGIQRFFGGSASITGVVGETGGHWNFDVTLTLQSAESAASFQNLYDAGSKGFGPPARFGPGPAIHFENASGPALGVSGTYIVSGTSHIDLYNPNTGFVGVAGHSAVDYVGGHAVQLFGGNIDPSSCPF